MSRLAATTGANVFEVHFELPLVQFRGIIVHMPIVSILVAETGRTPRSKTCCSQFTDKIVGNLSAVLQRQLPKIPDALIRCLFGLRYGTASGGLCGNIHVFPWGCASFDGPPWLVPALV